MIRDIVLYLVTEGARLTLSGRRNPVPVARCQAEVEVALRRLDHRLGRFGTLRPGWY